MARETSLKLPVCCLLATLAPSASTLLAAIIERRIAEPATKAAVEIGGLVEAAGECDLADLEVIVAAIGEHPPRLLHAQLEHAFGQADAGFAQELLDIARGDAGPCRDDLDREGGVGKAARDLAQNVRATR